MTQKTPKIFAIAFISAIVLSSSGCVILPFPAYQTMTLGCSGKVIDSKTRNPVTNAVISLNYALFDTSTHVERKQFEIKKHTVSTDQKGHFKIKPKRYWYVIRVYSMTGDFPFPLPDDWEGSFVSPQTPDLLYVYREGYKTKKLSLRDKVKCDIVICLDPIGSDKRTKP